MAIDTLADMEVLFGGIALDDVTTSMTINSAAPTVLAMYVTLADRAGIPRDRVGGTIQNDILKEYQAQHAWIVPAEPALRMITDVFAHCAERVPQWNTVSISASRM
mgnify:CR=1 FL=1